ncbi:AtpZ/AtpI family protein [Methylocella sp.]|uniref:AtpZ/AtpI family protein n=1 Tax=Methylocella sp. TaxID=1978226 RepID=UPI0037847E4C
MGVGDRPDAAGRKGDDDGRKAADAPLDPEAAALRARLDRLAVDLRASDEAQAPDDAAAEASARTMGSAMSLGFRVLTEFVSAVAVGAFVGWQIDSFAGTSPLFLLVLLMLGTAAGFWNVYRIAVGRQGLKP